jgi:hypothetical protein
VYAVIGAVGEFDAGGVLPFGGDEGRVLFGGEFTEDLRVLRQDGVVLGRIGQARTRGTEVFMLDGADEDEAHLAARAGCGDEVHELEHLAAEFGGAVVEAVARRIGIQDWVVLPVSEFVQTRRHAVTEDRHGRLHDRELFLQAVHAFGDGVKTGARSAEGAVAAITEVANGEITAGEFAAHLGLQVPEVVFAFDEDIADEQDAIAVLERELRLGEGAEGTGQKDGQREERAQGRTHG